jgi:hypothetical protein
MMMKKRFGISTLMMSPKALGFGPPRTPAERNEWIRLLGEKAVSEYEYTLMDEAEAILQLAMMHEFPKYEKEDLMDDDGHISGENLSVFPFLEASLMASIVTIELDFMGLLPSLEKWLRKK